MGDGGYSAKNGARSAPLQKLASTGASLGEDFPMLCETCLGQNPYVRMTKMPFGEKLCKISNVPYQAFRWKAGGGRHKETIICHAVAADRNICQTCLNDMV
jgi:pre-mRNA-splicing factor RBM22/SLT11